MILEEVERVRAKERVKAGVKIDDPSDGSSQGLDKGRSVDIVAKKVGLKSGRQYERGRNVLKKIDELVIRGRGITKRYPLNQVNDNSSTCIIFGISFG